MTLLVFMLCVLVAGYFAGFLGSLLGLGGGIVLIPVFTLLMGIDIRYGVGAALVASIATSSGSASAYVREGIINMRLGMFLEIATTLGAIAGTVIALYLNNNALAIVFGLMLIFTSVMTYRKKIDHDPHAQGSTLAAQLRLNASYPTPQGTRVSYRLARVWTGFSIMGLAGAISGILGIGAGVVKVIAMDTAMGVPFKVSTTTSNFMIGVTAATGAVVYWQRGYIVPELAAPVIVGVLLGAFSGSKLLKHLPVRVLRIIFSVVTFVVALQMLYKGVLGQF
ncbi:MAG: sulfite exporter TauE/SafE family protein [Bacteroidales bacterium]|nr:sulfite exporter TauE/SafE family protein [Bacteroidales bacterium]